MQQENKITVQLVDKIANALAKELVHHQIPADQFESVLMILLGNALMTRAVLAKDDTVYYQRLKEIVNFMEKYPNLVNGAFNNPEVQNLPN